MKVPIKLLILRYATDVEEEERNENVLHGASYSDDETVKTRFLEFKLSVKCKALKDKLWECVRATTVQEFGRKMDEMNLSKEAFDWLAQKPPGQWSKSHFNTIPICDMLLNNICESFNAQLIPARSKPILTGMEMIRTLLMKMIQVRRDGMRKYIKKICPIPRE
ncbi:hypothetical protein M0R45_035169 [Rubus argutus]|uniref:Uncharacterized protein n=1 Tax=Rubus argutus TaxID=59490 RepID=A0AAW1VS93_RUBAR